MTYRRLLYPTELIGSLPLREPPETLSKLHDYSTTISIAHRVPIRFNAPIDLVIRVSSLIGARKRWVRAGYMAQLLYKLPGEPKNHVSRLYLDERFFQFEAIGHSFYFEFWPYVWITDYRIEVWVRRTQLPLGLRIQGNSLTFDGDILTVDGEPIYL